jgi:hypothetical protein
MRKISSKIVILTFELIDLNNFTSKSSISCLAKSTVTVIHLTLLFADFKETFPIVSQAINEASFLAIDTEFSGISYVICYYILMTVQINWFYHIDIYVVLTACV